MNTINTPVNANTRTNARILTKYLKRNGYNATAPRAKDGKGVWQVSCTVSRRKTFIVKNNKPLLVNRGTLAQTLNNF